MLNQYAVGQSHVTSQPTFFPPFQNPGGMLSRSLGMPSRNDRRKFIEDQNTILGLSGRVQELQRIFRMLNQYAVEIPTLPVDQCHSHLIRYLKAC